MLAQIVGMRLVPGVTRLDLGHKVTDIWPRDLCASFHLPDSPVAVCEQFAPATTPLPIYDAAAERNDVLSRQHRGRERSHHRNWLRDLTTDPQHSGARSGSAPALLFWGVVQHDSHATEPSLHGTRTRHRALLHSDAAHARL